MNLNVCPNQTCIVSEKVQLLSREKVYSLKQQGAGLLVRPGAGVAWLYSSMAYMVGSTAPRLDRIRRLFFPRSVTEGDNPRKLFSLPIFQVRYREFKNENS